ncbi:amidohydrolase family protein [Actinomadura sp. WMMB 499]|uniref:amidohydrolase family protein n=1 Tax=Actinomadura sp. WMMB 499 TaxID=1219491 RepID=UPI001246DF95|nr:amidohydrolase family protein [Actinomadura sp. WMMB 499]QFG22419.1 amidohydrolase [Actinomadura sp. WMMB 499]
MTVIDAHAHLLIPALERKVADLPGFSEHRSLEALRNGPESMEVNAGMISERLPRLTSLDRRLADMDRTGVDIQIVSPSPSHYHSWAEPGMAGELARIANESIVAHCSRAPNRLHGLGLVPLQHPDLAADVLDEAMDMGLKGVEIPSHVPGMELSHPGLEIFWARAAARGAVVFLHPFGCTLNERLDRWYLSNIVGQPVENAVALSHLIFSGVLDRYPDLKLLAAHGGGYLPTYLGRSDHGWRTRPDARGCIELPSTYLRRIWFDSLVYTPQVLRALIAAVGVDRVVMGSDHPFDMGNENPAEAVRAALSEDAELKAVLGANAADLFTLSTSPPSNL